MQISTDDPTIELWVDFCDVQTCPSNGGLINSYSPNLMKSITITLTFSGVYVAYARGVVVVTYTMNKEECNSRITAYY